jgi:hypothetical protein
MRRRTLVLLGASFVFGAALAAVKGQGADVRDAVGNMSAPWLLVPFLAGASRPGWFRGAALGLAATVAALAGFYAAESLILDLGPHPWLVDLELTFRAGRIYFVQGIVSGPIFGALGGLWATKKSAAIGVLIALLFVAEPLAVWLYERRTGPAGGPGSLTHYPALWMTEVAVGVVAAVWMIRHGRSTSGDLETRVPI